MHVTVLCFLACSARCWRVDVEELASALGPVDKAQVDDVKLILDDEAAALESKRVGPSRRGVSFAPEALRNGKQRGVDGGEVQRLSAQAKKELAMAMNASAPEDNVQAYRIGDRVKILDNAYTREKMNEYIGKIVLINDNATDATLEKPYSMNPDVGHALGPSDIEKAPLWLNGVPNTLDEDEAAKLEKEKYGIAEKKGKESSAALPSWAARHPEGSDTPDRLHDYFVRRLLKIALPRDELVKQILLRPEDKAEVLEFLQEYTIWAAEQDWEIVHEFEVEKKSTVVVAGDLHGHFASLRAVYHASEYLGKREGPASHLVFLGNFIGRGRCEVETAIAILALQMHCNLGRVIVLRGNHEHSQGIKFDPGDIHKFHEYYTFYGRIAQRFNLQLTEASDAKWPNDIWGAFLKAFWQLPAAAIMKRGTQKYMMVHGGFNADVLKNWKAFNKNKISELQLPHLDLPSTINVMADAQIHGRNASIMVGVAGHKGSLAEFSYGLTWSDFRPERVEFGKGKLYDASDLFGVQSYGHQAVLKMMKQLNIDWFISGHRHENVLTPFLQFGYTKGQAVVLSANSYGPRTKGKLLLIDTPKQLSEIRKEKKQGTYLGVNMYSESLAKDGVHSFILTVTCCCRYVWWESTCKARGYHFVAQKGSGNGLCCKLKQGGDHCERVGKNISEESGDVGFEAGRKYRHKMHPKFCGSPPVFRDLDEPSDDVGQRFIARVTAKKHFTEGHSQPTWSRRD